MRALETEGGPSPHLALTLALTLALALALALTLALALALTQVRAGPRDGGRPQRRRLACLASLGIWRASGVLNSAAPPSERATSVSMRSVSTSLRRAFSMQELRRGLDEAAESQAELGEATADAVRRQHEEKLSSLVVKRLTLLGMLREKEYRIDGALREQNYETKREARPRAVQSGICASPPPSPSPSPSPSPRRCCAWSSRACCQSSSRWRRSARREERSQRRACREPQLRRAAPRARRPRSVSCVARANPRDAPRAAARR